jgi:hypothetical protein
MPSRFRSDFAGHLRTGVAVTFADEECNLAA